MGGHRENSPGHAPTTPGRDVGEPAGLDPMLGLVGGDRFAAEMPIYAVAKSLEDTVRFGEASGLPFRPSVPVDTVVALVDRLVALLRGAPETLSNHTAHQVEMAVFATARAAVNAEDDDQAILNALATNLSHAATSRGIKLAADLPGSRVIALSTTDTGRAATNLSALSGEVELLVAEVGALTDPTAMEQRIAASVPRLRALLRTLSVSSAALLGADLSKLFAPLFRLGRQHRLDLAGSHLDQLFNTEDHFLSSAGLDAPNHAIKYYADRTAAQLDDDPTNDGEDDAGPRVTASTLVDEISDHYRSGPFHQHLALTGIAEMLSEPPPPRDVSTFEKVLGAVAQAGMSAIAGHLSSLFSSALRAIAANPGAVAAAVGDVAGDVGGVVADGARAVDRHLPRPVSRGARAVGRGAARVGRAATKGARAVGGHFDVAPEVIARLSQVGGQMLTHTNTKDDVVKLISPDLKPVVNGIGEAKKEKPGSDTIVPSFIAAMTERIGAYSQQVIAHLPRLQAELRLLPPGALQAMLDELRSAGDSLQATLRVELAQRWTAAIAAAVHGLDESGTVASAPWQEFKRFEHRKGIVKLKLHVKQGRGPMGLPVPTPVVVQAPRIAGLGPTLLAELQQARIPLADALMHREIEFTFTDQETGVPLRAGIVQMSPEGNLDFGASGDLFDFASISRGDVPDAPHGNLAHVAAEATGKANPADSAHIVRLLLETTGLHTGNLHHDETAG